VNHTRLSTQACIAAPSRRGAALLLLATALGCAPLTPPSADPPPPPRVVLVSLDGLGQEIWEEDPAARELRALRRVAERGVAAPGLIQAFPSATPGGHASLWTGAFPDVHGISASSNPLLPRAEHTVLERGSGFDARALLAEPLWVTAARQGVTVVGHQVSQNHPFIPFITAPGAPVAPVLLTGYRTPMLAPHRVLRRADVQEADPAPWAALQARSSLPLRAFTFQVGGAPVHAALVAEPPGSTAYTAMYLAADPAGHRVRAVAAPAESAEPRGRPLARHFSAGLPLTVGEEGSRTLAFFRLFELAPGGDDFLLYHPSLHTTALHDGTGREEELVDALLAEGGAFIGNGPSWLWRDGELGTQLYAGGDGTAERRYLEGVELVLRQYDILTRWLVRNYEPRLLIDYSNYPDEVDHWWYGFSHPATPGVPEAVRAGYAEFRRLAYAALDGRVALLDSVAGADGALLVTADHGMTPVWREVHVNRALRDAGLLALGADGRIDISRTRAVYHAYSVLINTDAWREGIVPAAERARVVDEVEAALRRVRDPQTGEAVFTAFFRPETHPELGIGGPTGGDIYFDVAPGFRASWRLGGGPVAERLEVPVGYHGQYPVRRDMQAVFIARGLPPRWAHGLPLMRATDVAPLVAETLGIEPPRDSVGGLGEPGDRD
jgi:hypothetical protein